MKDSALEMFFGFNFSRGPTGHGVHAQLAG